uniref:RING-type domain-containing protein n=1 Tax=viral metagenome TaxID=1070528 RepID=A0A6C0D1J8_9ZZZZ
MNNMNINNSLISNSLTTNTLTSNSLTTNTLTSNSLTTNNSFWNGNLPSSISDIINIYEPRDDLLNEIISNTHLPDIENQNNFNLNNEEVEEDREITSMTSSSYTNPCTNSANSTNSTTPPPTVPPLPPLFFSRSRHLPPTRLSSRSSLFSPRGLTSRPFVSLSQSSLSSSTFSKHSMTLQKVSGRRKENKPGHRWDNLCEKDRYMYKEAIRLLKSFLCPICHEVCPKRYLVCSNGHCVCKHCFGIQTKNLEMQCCLCRRPFLNLSGILLREEEECISTMISWIFSLSHFNYPSWVDVFIHEGEVLKNPTSSKSLSLLTGKWYVGHIQSMDIESEMFQVSVLGFSEIFSKHIFSDDLEPLFSHTPDWRSFQNLKIGSMIDILLYSGTILDTDRKRRWVEGTIVFTDSKSNRIFVVFQDIFNNDTLEVKPFSFMDYESPIAPHQTFTTTTEFNERTNGLLIHV